jgi:hypothetical protein
MMLLIILLYISVILNIAFVVGMVLRKRGDEDIMTIRMRDGLNTD